MICSKLCLFLVVGGLSYEVRVSAMDEYQTGEEVVGRIELPDEGKLFLYAVLVELNCSDSSEDARFYPHTRNGVLSMVFK